MRKEKTNANDMAVRFSKGLSEFEYITIPFFTKQQNKGVADNNILRLISGDLFYENIRY